MWRKILPRDSSSKKSLAPPRIRNAISGTDKTIEEIVKLTTGEIFEYFVQEFSTILPHKLS